MRKLLFILLLFTSLISQGSTYYIATTGSDSNAGTIGSPWATWEKITGNVVAGDIVYIRGGTYRSTKSAGTETRCNWNGLNGNATDTIKIYAYPGETPIFNMDNISITADYSYGIIFYNSDYVHVKGLRVTGMPQRNPSNLVVGLNIWDSNHCLFEDVELDNIGGYGFYISTGATDLTFENCDAHDLADPYSAVPYGGSNGFSITGNVNANNIIFNNCRAYFVSDDGWDFYDVDGYFEMNNCWAFYNGYDNAFNVLGDGNGFKLGPQHTSAATTLKRKLTNCIAAGNRVNGFDQNTANFIIHIFNSISYDNGSYGLEFAWNSNVHVFKNNISYDNGTANIHGADYWDDTNNTWNAGVTVTADDFESLDITQLDNARGSDGTLPSITFGHLVEGSDLIDAGVYVGIDFEGSAPDIGAFEYLDPPVVPSGVHFKKSGNKFLKSGTRFIR